MMRDFTTILAELNVDASRISDLIDRDLQAWMDADEKAVELWMHMQAMSDVLNRNMRGLNAFGFVIGNVSDLMHDSVMALEAGVTRYNEGLDAIDERISTILFQMSLTVWFHGSFAVFIITVCTLLPAVSSRKLRLAFLVPIALGYYIVEFSLKHGWMPILNTALTVLSISLNNPWSISIGIGTIVLGTATMVVMALYKRSVAQLDGGLIPRIEMPVKV